MAARGRSRGRVVVASSGGNGGPAPVGRGRGGPAPVGRGRGRGASAVAPPNEQLQQMNIQQPAASAGVRERGTQVVLRPANAPPDLKGTTGNRVSMLTNFFEIRTFNKQPLYQYHVDFNPGVAADSLSLRKALVHKIQCIKDKHEFDGTILYSPMKLPKDENEFTVQKRDGDTVKITIKITREVPPGDDQFMQLVNIIFNRIADKHMGLERIRRDYFDPSKPVKIPQHRVELWPGFEFSIRKYDHGVLLGVDVKHKILRTDSALNVMNVISSNGRGGQSAIKAEMIGAIVMTKYNNKTYKIDDVNFDITPRNVVQLKNGPISYVDYYKKNYEITITDLNQPLLLSRVKSKETGTGNRVEREIHLVPEVCFMTGLTDQMRKNFNVMRDLAQHTKQDPNQKESTLRGFKDTINASPEASEYLRNWNLEMAPVLLDVEGRKLPPEQIICNPQTCKTFPCDPKKESFDNITRKKFVITSADIKDDYLIICTSKDKANATTFIDTCVRVGPACGINIGRGRVVEVRTDNARDFINAIQQNFNSNIRIVVCLVPNDRKDRYDSIKKYCCVDMGIISQVLVTRNLNPKKAMSVVTKVCLQMNAKLGGELWSVNIPMKGVMYIGIDTYHDSGSNKSVGGFVASINDICTRYFSKTTWQESKQELISQLEACTSEALKSYHDFNKAWPSRVIVFRDGVGDGQLAAVKAMELDSIEKALSKLPNKPEFIFAVVTKRIQQRFMQKMGNKLGNPAPGTVVDSKITNSNLFDFFLVPQHVGQGTVTPTHYNILEFRTKIKPDHLQQIAFKLCHMYFNWTGTIRVPAVCQYAHKLAFLVGESLHRDPHARLAQFLFYL